MGLLLVFPDGSKAALDADSTHGRGTHTSLVDSFLSRQHMSLKRIEGLQDVVVLTNLGQNPLVVQALQPGQDPSVEGSWQQTASLQQGQDTCIGPSTRFFVVTRPQTTTLTLLSTSTVPDSSAGPVSRTAQTAPNNHAAADAELAASLAAEDEAAAARTADHYDSDAQLAAMLAAAEVEPAGAAAGDSRSAGNLDPPAKRHKGQHHAVDPAAAASNASTGGGQASRTGGQGCLPEAPPPLGETPYALLAVNNHAFDPAWNAGCLGVRLQQLVSGDIQLALVSNYMMNDWEIFPVDMPGLLRAKQVCLVEGLTMRQKGPTGSRWYERGQAFATAAETAFQAAAAFFDLPPPELCCHSPETESWGTHHSKAFLFGYADGGVRVVVHTANLVVGDCNYKTQGVWWQDFPPKQQQQGQGPGQQQQQGRQQPATEFERTLSAYLHSLKLPGPWGQRMQQLVAGADFSAARGVLIGSVPGRHEGASRDMWGHMAVRRVLSQHAFPERFKSADTVLQCSSLGSINQRWLEELQDSFNAGRYVPDTSTPQASAAAAAAAAAAGGGPAEALPEEQQKQKQQWPQQLLQQQRRRPRLHFIWPTAEEVRGSIEGWGAGGSIPGRRQNVSADCLQHIFRRWDGAAVGRQQAMPHIKTFGRILAMPNAHAASAAGCSAHGSSNHSTLRPNGSHPAAEQQQQQHLQHEQRLERGDRKETSTLPLPPPLQQHQQQQQQQQQGAPGGGGDRRSGVGGSVFEAPWWLVTSHNLSKAAWGELQKGGQALYMRSYELGVLCLPELEAAYRRHPHRFYSCTPERVGVVPASCPGPVRFFAWNQPPQTQAQQQQQQQQELPNTDTPGTSGQAASGCSSGDGSSTVVYIPVPYTLPPQRYSMDGRDRPWSIDEDFPEVDRFGRRCPNLARQVNKKNQ